MGVKGGGEARCVVAGMGVAINGAKVGRAGKPAAAVPGYLQGPCPKVGWKAEGRNTRWQKGHRNWDTNVTGYVGRQALGLW